MKQAGVGAGAVLMLASAVGLSQAVGLGARDLRREWKKTLLAEESRLGKAGWGQRSRAFACRKWGSGRKQR